jgi:hypothetical protein
MKIIVTRKGIMFVLRWNEAQAVFRVVAMLLAAVRAFYLLPQVMQVGRLLGWW